MANTLGTLSSALIIQRALELVFTKRPMLGRLTLDLSDSQVDFGQQVISRIHSVPSVEDFGEAATNRADVDVPVTLDQFKQITHKFTVQEISSTKRNLVDESAEPMAIALANHMVDAIAANWSLANFELAQETVETIANTDYQTLLDLRKALTLRGVNEDNRFLALNVDAYSKLLEDPTVIDANRNPSSDSIASGQIRGVAGFRDIYEYPALPTASNMTGFAGTADTAVIASRVPRDPRQLLPNAPFPGNMGVITDPATGLSVMVNEWIEPGNLSANVRLIWMYGTAKGNPNNGQRLVSVTNA